MNIHILTRSTWFSVAHTAKKLEVFFAVWAIGNQLQFNVAMASSQKFHFSVYCLFICLLCAYIHNFVDAINDTTN